MTVPHPSDRPAGGPRLLVLAGEVSGDQHAAALVRALRARLPGLQCYGMGGEALRAAGVETRFDLKDLAVMGIWEVLLRQRFFRRVLREMADWAAESRPDAVLLVDYPGFNLRLAREVHARGLKTIYYICPKVWAWKASRIPKIAASVDRLLAIFPFEPRLFDATGLKVDFVGNPLVDEAQQAWAQTPPQLPWDGDPQVALLPGSREHEIRRLLPILWQTARLIEQRFPLASFIVPAPNAQVERIVRATQATLPPGPSRWACVSGQTHQVLRQARAALVASGTATLDACLMRCPMVITYKVAALSWRLGKLLVKIPFVGLVNIIAGRAVCPELLQGAATPVALATALEPLLTDTPARAAMLASMAEVAGQLGAPGASARAAEIIAAEIARK